MNLKPKSDPVNTVSLREFYQEAANIFVTCHSDLFIPDHWTKTLAAGLEKVDFSGSVVLEVGVGIGINMAGLLTSPKPPSGFIGTDLCNNAINASGSLAELEGFSQAIFFRSDLLKDVPDAQLEKIDHIFACIPQVPSDCPLEDGDNSAHYYNGKGCKWDKYGLGLNADLIKEATERAPQASITLNLAGRPGIERLKQIFTEAGRRSEVLYDAIVPQHSGTTLSPLVDLETNGLGPFEFFADPEGESQINAAEAEALRVINAPVYHKIYVVTAGPV